MRQRIRAAGLVLMILIVGFGLIVAVTEHEAGANAAGQDLVTTGDVLDALNDAGVNVAPGRGPAHHPLLDVTGTTLEVETGWIQVYVYPDVSARVAAEQVIQRQLAQLQAFATGDESIFRVTSARNVLLLVEVGSNQELARVYNAARSLAGGDER